MFGELSETALTLRVKVQEHRILHLFLCDLGTLLCDLCDQRIV